MIALKIFRLEDSEEADALSTLSEGEHVIGRGFLNCNDKRVSRRHAVILIEKGEVTIKSVHVNPCFYKSSTGNSISIIPKNKSVTLNDNDQFALLSDNFWFKVKVIMDNQMESETKSMVSENIMENVPILDGGPTTKKRNSGEINDVSHKKQKISSVTTTSNFDDMHDASIIELPGVTTADTLLNNVETIAAEDFDRSISNHSITEINSGVEIKHVFDNNSEVLNLLVDKEVNCGKKEKVDLNATEGIEDIVQEGELVQSKEDQNDPTIINNEKQDINPCQQLDLMITDGLSNSVIETFDKVDELNNIKKRNTDLIHKDTDQNIAPENVNNEFLNVNNVSDGTNASDNTDSASDNVNNACVFDNTNNVSAPDINSTCDTINNASGNTNSSSDNINIAPPMKTRRERCWYGQACYRKKPQHRLDFSHPGDDDYDSDPDDDRPNCPFGNQCYRVNLDHRREFKHRGKPFPKPNDINPSTSTTSTTSNQIPKPKKKRNKKKKQQRKNESQESNISDDDNGQNTLEKRKAAMKKKYRDETPEDDYDYQDPFIDDGSSDEFELSEDDDDDDDTDWEDSQVVDEESQETRRLLKEAKKFTRGKGKKGT